MIKQLLKIVWTQRRSNMLIWMELLLVFILLWMVTDQLYGLYNKYRIPIGFNIENTYSVDIQMVSGRELTGDGGGNEDSLSKAYEEPFYALLEKIKRNANVECASAGILSRPYNNGNSWSDVKFMNKKSSNYIRKVDSDFFKVFQIPITYGRGLSNVGSSEIVISKMIADSLFKSNSSALGKQCRINDEKFTIVGVTKTYKYYDFADETPTSYQQFAPAFKNRLGSMYVPEICIRLKPNAPKDAIELLKKELSDIGDSPYYIKEIVPFEKLRESYFVATGEINTLRFIAAIIIFFLVNVLLGVVGTFWFRTEQRKNEIGLRMAIGSSSQAIRSFFLKESLVLMVLSAIPGILIIVQFKYFNIHLFDYWDRSWVVFTLGGITAFAILSAMVLLGTWIPVRQASKVQPSEALHYE